MGVLRKQLMIRVSDDLYRRLLEDARRNERTVSQSVRFYLNKSVPSFKKG